MPAPRARLVRALVTLVLSVSLAGTVSASETASAAPGAQVTTPSSTRAAPTAAARARAATCRTNLWAHLAACGWAGPTNTGPRLGSCRQHRLRAWGRDPRATITIDRPGTVVSCRRIVGCLDIEAPGVTVRNVRIRCTSGRTGEDANGTSVIAVGYGASARISRVAIDGMRGVHACIWHAGQSVSITRINCRGVDDGVFSWGQGDDTAGNNFTIRRSFFHDFTTRTANGHIDGYQTEGASNGLIQGNTFLMTTDDGNESDSAIAIWDVFRSSSDITVAHNLIAGGGFSVYAHDNSPSEADPTGGNSVTAVSFVGNVFSTRLFGCVGYYGVWFPRGQPTDGWARSGDNRVLESGQNLDGGNPSYAGRSCT